MSSMLSSKGLVLATAMAVSAGTMIAFDLLKEKYFPSTQLPRIQESSSQKQILKSCLSSGSKKGEKKRKKKVQFAVDVKDSSGNGEVYRKLHRKKKVQFAIDVKDSSGNGEVHRKLHRNHRDVKSNSCGTQILELQGTPPNHVALYSGILKSRISTSQYSY